MPSVWLPSIAHHFPPYHIMGRAQFLCRNCARFIFSDICGDCEKGEGFAHTLQDKQGAYLFYFSIYLFYNI